MIYPHALFAKLFATNREEFGKRFFGGAVQTLRAFWDSQADHPSYDGHPLQDHEFAHKDKACPLFIHGDDVASIGMGKIWSKAINVLSFGGLLSHGSFGGLLPHGSLARVFLLWMFFYCIASLR